MIKKFSFIIAVALFLAVIFIVVLTSGVFAVFQYSRLPARTAYSDISSNIGSFSYGGYPEGFDEEHKTVIDVAVSSEPGGLNSDDFSGFKLAITFTWVGGRATYGYVGSMDKWFGNQFGTPENVAFVMTLPQNDPEQRETIYIYVVKILQSELNDKQIGDTLENVYRVKLVKNDEGMYEQEECLKGSSPVVYYEYSQYKQLYDLNAFAVFNGETLWTEN